MRFYSGFATTKGPHRNVNQDSIAVFEVGYGKDRMIMALVCDGMGGEENGEKASRACLEVLEKWFSNVLIEYEPDFSIIKIKKSLEKIIKFINELLCQYTYETGIRIGTTLSLIFINCKNEYIVCHVGDSRIYLINKKICQLTMDQKKNNNTLIECVGITDNINIYFKEGLIDKGDAFLICSDGLYKKMAERELFCDLRKNNWKRKIKKLTAEKERDASEIINNMLINLIKKVIKKEEKDNISAVFIISED